MPSRNSVKKYQENGYYHIYNRGVEKRLIFQDKQDYYVFLSYLKEYLLPKDEQELSEKLSNPSISALERDKIIKKLRLNNFCGEISLLVYCLMPNHFHFFVKQKSALSIDKFMQSLCTRYTMYFNRKYKRVGSLFQAVYKAVSIETDEQFLYLSKYIHKQALALPGETLEVQEIQPSSFGEYVGKRKSEWIITDEIISYFSKNNPALSYKKFVLEQNDYSVIQNLVLDDL